MITMTLHRWLPRLMLATAFTHMAVGAALLTLGALALWATRRTYVIGGV